MWKIPEAECSAAVCTEDGTRIALRRYGNRRGPRLVLSHGNGLAIDLYYPFWSLLTERFDVIVYDFRNHGRNPPSASPNHDIATFVSDNERIFRGIERLFGDKPWVGVFHSLSAITILNHSPPGANALALVLFDPPIFAKSGDQLDLDRLYQRFRRLALWRHGSFEKREHFAQAFRDSGLMERALPGVPELASEALLRSAADGDGYEPRCPPEYEARVNEYFFAYNSEPELGSLRCPVKVIGADPTLPASFLPGFTTRSWADVDYDFVPDTTHYLQIEKPKECTGMMSRFLEKQNFAG